MRQVASFCGAAELLLVVNTAGVDAQPVADDKIDPLKIATKVTDDLCRLDTDAAAVEAVKYMPGSEVEAKLKHSRCKAM